MPLHVKGKLNNASICNGSFCFKHQFIIVEDLNIDVILGTPFLTQIYPFWVNESGVGTKIMGTSVIFKFLSPVRHK